MKQFAIALLLAFTACCAIAQDKAPATSTPDILNHSLSSVENEFVPAVEAMPDEKFNFAPSPSMGEFKGVRTFADQAKHVAAVNYMLGAAILGEKPPVELKNESAPDSVKTKADTVKFVKDSFAYAHKALGALNQDNIHSLVQIPWGPQKDTRAALALIMLEHPWDHYGQMVEYLRMNGIVPPASRGQ